MIDPLIRFLVPLRPWSSVPWTKMSRWERSGYALFVALLLAGLPIAVNRAVQRGGTDFPKFYDSGRCLLEHGTRNPDTALVRYLPSMEVPWVLLAWMPLPVAVGVWYAVGCWSWCGLLAAVSRYLLTDADETTRREATLGAGLLAMPLALDGLCLGSFHLLMVWLLLAALGRVSQNRCWSGGILLGVAIWVKLLPALGVGYLLLKRKWMPAAVAVACVLAIDVVLSVAAYGPQGAWQEHLNWWSAEAVGATGRQLVSPTPVYEDCISNQSVAVTLRRVFTRLGTDPGHARELVRIADLSASQLELAYAATTGLLATAVALYWRRPGRGLSARQWATEIAMLVLSTLWFSPVVWSYHPTAATPALALVLSRLARRRRLLWTIVALWLLSLALLAFPVARVLGNLLWMSLLLGAALVWTGGSPRSGEPDRVGPGKEERGRDSPLTESQAPASA
jgi:hypothetical protein